MKQSPPAEPRRSLVAIVFTDIVGYSALVHRDDANAMRLVDEHFKLVREIATGFGGRVIKTIGDSVHLEFGSAQAATTCAIAVQQRHHQRNTQVAEPQRFDIRIGVHLGDVEHRGGDIYGDGVNIAARLQPLAPVGGIAISEHVRGQLREELRGRFASQGAQSLKNIGTPVEVFTVEAGTIADLPVEQTASAPHPARTRTSPRRFVLIGVGIAALAGLVLLLAPFLRSPPAVVENKSIAVLPFADLSPGKDQEYFSDGIAEDLLNVLAKVETLQVAARTSSFSFKGKDIAIPEIAKALHVANVLEGSVRKSGNQVRVSARLVRAADGFEIWSQTWDRTLDDIFKVQDEITAAVVSELRVKLLGDEPTVKPVDPKVYPMILQAQALASQGSVNGDTQAIAVYEQAIALAPDESRAWAGMARVYLNRGLTGTDVAESIRLAQEAANKALELDPENAMALGLVGRIAADVEHDLPKAARSYQRALELEPGNLLVINAAATMLLYMGHFDEALPLYEYRVVHDPAHPSAYNNLGNCLYAQRRWDAAIEAYRTALRLSPEYGGAHSQIGLSFLLGKHDPAAALKEFEAETDEVSRLVSLPLALHVLGRTKEADAATQAFIDKFGDELGTFAAVVYAYRGETDKAFTSLEKSVALHDPYASQVLMEPLLDSLHDDPRWLPLLRKIGYAPEQLAKIELKVTLPQTAETRR